MSNTVKNVFLCSSCQNWLFRHFWYLKVVKQRHRDCFHLEIVRNDVMKTENVRKSSKTVNYSFGVAKIDFLGISAVFK